MKAYLFPGQGSQRAGMGGSLFAAYDQLSTTASRILGYDIATRCLHDPDKSLNDTLYTQPALYVVGALMYLDKTAEENPPDYMLGHSLGEYVALFAAGAFSFETGLELVKKRAEIMSGVKHGGMAAVVGLTMDQVLEVLHKYDYRHIDIANYNSREQVVISGLKEEVLAAQADFQANGARLYFPLNVSGAFHSRYMAAATEAFRSFLTSYHFQPLQRPVIANVTARPYDQHNVAALLVEQLTNPVKWYESISFLRSAGVHTFTEVGPGNVLTKLNDFITAAPMEITTATNGATAKQTVNGNGHTPAAELVIKATSLGTAAFRQRYKIRYAYLSGAMVHGIASKELVIRMAKAGMMGFLGTGGVDPVKVAADIRYIQEALQQGEAYGINLLNSPREEEMVDVLLQYKVPNVEAAAYIQVSKALVRLRLTGLRQLPDGTVVSPVRIIAKLSRPEVAENFLRPAAPALVAALLQEQKITAAEAALATAIPVADDICVEADSGGHTDMGVAFTLLPTMIRLRDDLCTRHGYRQRINVGAAGGIGTPEAAAAAFVLGADFILTGSINQCTVEAATSDAVKDLLQNINVQDTAYAPAGDMFETGARVQVLKKGVLFPGRANKLYELYKQYNSIDEIDADTREQIASRYFQRSFEAVYQDCEAYYPPEKFAAAKANPKQMMAYLFRWYFGYSGKIAETGDEQQRVNFQVHCGPALGAFNQWVKGTPLENWRNRHADDIALKIMQGAADILHERVKIFTEAS
ncbi:ACP S-malonyltransferase [Chitinophaga nivalis]|uniref:[acyl-carrier-protein] S-malonyltransferase n=1 Tax=Chitinophaga nivalis TaxID=2991709 RepID=A0ABT3IJH8_9BACT|nr:ACP S-malonyltransferase [Chitinophaga nivalis]MCW3466238.1 ACP S-malonyltransferase [Chitinophaga nivalis]MCW3484071.1 ACP S-malonyltransferase [Chitinophaga nivalis]